LPDDVGGDRIEACDHTQRRRLAAAGESDEENEFAAIDAVRAGIAALQLGRRSISPERQALRNSSHFCTR
jgi:hypothetical protein